MSARLVLIADASSARVIDDTIGVLASVERGAVMVIERDKIGADDRARLRRLERLRVATREAGCMLVVNGRVDLALACEADGVQLPEDGLAPEVVRRAWPHMKVGRSCHDRAGAEIALRSSDWVLLAPLRSPHSKPGTGRALGWAGVREVMTGLAGRVYVLGGVRPDDAATALQAGLTGLATIGGVFGTDAPIDAARGFLDALAMASTGPG